MSFDVVIIFAFLIDMQIKNICSKPKRNLKTDGVTPLTRYMHMQTLYLFSFQMAVKFLILYLCFCYELIIQGRYMFG